MRAEKHPFLSLKSKYAMPIGALIAWTNHSTSGQVNLHLYSLEHKPLIKITEDDESFNFVFLFYPFRFLNFTLKVLSFGENRTSIN